MQLIIGLFIIALIIYMTIAHSHCGKTYDDKYSFKHLNSIHHQNIVEYRWKKDDTMKNTGKENTERIE